MAQGEDKSVKGEKGLTPVIAIILLLLMTVAAAGGFYFVYQNFASSGEESGSSQIDALGEQTLSAIEIESVSAGKIYIKNVGATTIDATKLSVFVDDVPVSATPNTENIAENSRGTLGLGETVQCQDECTIKISGPGAFASSKVQGSKLSCAGSNECSSTETCLDGLCKPSRDELLIVMDSNLTARMIRHDGTNYVVTDMFVWTDSFNAISGAVLGDTDGDGAKEVIVGGFRFEE